jgi:hypothetical protein
MLLERRGAMSGDFELEKMLEWTRDLYSFGIKRPGTEEGARTEEYLLGLLKGFGIPIVTAEEVPFRGWFHNRAFLVTHGKGGSKSFPAEPIVYTAFTPPAGISAPVVDLGSSPPEEFAARNLAGKIALVTYRHGYIQYESVNDLGYYLHDPGETLKGGGQVMSWVTEEERRVYQSSVDAGAVGFIGVFPLEITPYLCFEGGNAFTGRHGPIPGIGLRRSEGEFLRECLSEDGVEATIILTGEMRSAVTRNIVGIVPGKSDRVIQVTSHHDSMWLGATEDAAGVAVVLALAKAYASKEPDITLAFVLEAAECLYVLGSRAYIERHRNDLIKNLIVDLHIEHLALEFIEDERGVLIPTGELQPRALFVTDRGPLIDIVKAAVIECDLRRTIMLPTDTPLGVPTDASAYNRAGLPVASFISPPLYWNALEDTWDKIAVEAMIPTAGAYSGIIEELLRTDPELIRKPGPPGGGYILE